MCTSILSFEVEHENTGIPVVKENKIFQRTIGVLSHNFAKTTLLSPAGDTHFSLTESQIVNKTFSYE